MRALLAALACCWLLAHAQLTVLEFTDNQPCAGNCDACFDSWACQAKSAMGTPCAVGKTRYSAQQLAEQLVGPASVGLRLEPGATLDCSSPLQVARAVHSANVWEPGVVLSTGLARQVGCATRSNSGAANSTNRPVWTPAATGDADLDLVTQELRLLINANRAAASLPPLTASELAVAAPSLGRCALRLEFTVLAGSSIHFAYAMGSAEYPLARSFGDVVAATLRDETTGASRNVLRVPTTNEPTNVVSVNPSNAASFFGRDFAAASPADVFGSESVFAMHGGTRMLLARAPVVRGNRYSLMVALASTATQDQDTALYVGPVRTDLSAVFSSPLNGNLIEGCSNGTIRLSLDAPSNLATPVTIRVDTQVGGWQPSDWVFDPLPDAVLGNGLYRFDIAANALERLITLHPLADGITEGVETLRVCLGTQCQEARVFDAIEVSAFASPATACVNVPGANQVDLVAVCPACEAVGAALVWEGPGIVGLPVGATVRATPPVGSTLYVVQARAPPVNPLCIAQAVARVTGDASPTCSQGTTRTATSATQPPLTTTTTVPAATTTTTSAPATTTSALTTTTATTSPAPTTVPPVCTSLPPQQPCLVNVTNLLPAVCVDRAMNFTLRTFSAPGVPARCGPLNCGDRSWVAVITWFTSYWRALASQVVYPSACTGGNYTFVFTPTWRGVHSIALSYASVPVRGNCNCPQLAPNLGFVTDSCNRCALPEEPCVDYSGGRRLLPHEYACTHDGQVVLTADAEAALYNEPDGTRILWDFGGSGRKYFA